MNKEIVERRMKELQTLYKYSETLSPDSEEYGTVLTRIDTLTKQIQAEAQIKSERLGVWLKAGVDALGIAAIVIPKLIFGTAAFEFEKENSISSNAGRTFLNWILRDK